MQHSGYSHTTLISIDNLKSERRVNRKSQTWLLKRNIEQSLKRNLIHTFSLRLYPCTQTVQYVFCTFAAPLSVLDISPRSPEGFVSVYCTVNIHSVLPACGCSLSHSFCVNVSNLYCFRTKMPQRYFYNCILILPTRRETCRIPLSCNKD